MSKKLHKYIRKEKFPTALCAGCGHGIVLSALLKSIDDLELNQRDIVIVSDNGCIGLVAGYLLFDVVHAPDSKSIPIAVGIKKDNPNLKVIVITGDGSLSSGGANHLMHAANKSLEITVICATNKIYAMAGGFSCATTPVGAITATAPAGHAQLPLDLCKVAYAGGAHYIARTSVYHVKQLTKSIKIGMLAKGLSFIEVISICPVEYGSRNGFKTPIEMLNNLRLNCVPSDIVAAIDQRGVNDRIAIGEYTKKG